MNVEMDEYYYTCFTNISKHTTIPFDNLVELAFKDLIGNTKARGIEFLFEKRSIFDDDILIPKRKETKEII